MKSFISENLKVVQKVFDNSAKQSPNKWDTRWVIEGKEFEKQGTKVNKKANESMLQKLKGTR